MPPAAAMSVQTSSPCPSPDKLFAASLQPPMGDKPMIGPYRLVRTLGRGSYATVKLAQHTVTGQEVAIKIVNKRMLDARALEKLRREISLARRVQHGYIVRQLDVLESAGHVYIVMEYVRGGELFTHISTGGALPERQARKLFLQLFAAVKHCHDLHIVHRDLKAENILLDENGNIKVADFGFSTVQTAALLRTFCGSPPYAAPELFCGIAYEGAAVDVWALGVLLYILVTARMPFSGRDLVDTRSRVCSGRFTMPETLSAELQSLIRRMLTLDPAGRASLDLFLDDAWLNADGDVREFLASAASSVEEVPVDESTLFRSVPSPTPSPTPSPSIYEYPRRSRPSLDASVTTPAGLRSPVMRRRRSLSIQATAVAPLVAVTPVSPRRHSAIPVTEAPAPTSLPPSATAARLRRSFKAHVTTPLAATAVLERISEIAAKAGLECSFPKAYTARISRSGDKGELSFDLRVCALVLSKNSRGVRAAHIQGDANDARDLLSHFFAEIKAAAAQH